MSRFGDRFGVLLPRVVAISTFVGAALLFVLPGPRAFLSEASGYFFPPDVEGLQGLLQGYGQWAWLVSSFLMLYQSLAAPIPAVPITLANALIYGPWMGALISWGSAQFAALVCYWLGKAMGRPFVLRLFSQRAVDRFDGFFDQYGITTILVARLLPMVGFDAVSYAAGLTRVRALAFFVATGIGQLPACIIYSYAGMKLVDEPSTALFLVFTFIGVMTLGAGIWWARHRRRSPALAEAAEGAGPRSEGPEAGDPPF